MLRTTGLLTAAALAMTAVAGCDQQDPNAASPEQLNAPAVNEAPAQPGVTTDDHGAAPADDTAN